MATEETTTITCYQCGVKEVLGGTKHFPFCSEGCKEAWGEKKYKRRVIDQPKYKSVEECQEKIREWIKHIREKEGRLPESEQRSLI